MAGETFHVVDENETSRGRYLELLEELTGHRHACVYLPVPPIAMACDGVASLRRITGATALPDVSGSKIRSRSVEARYDTSRLEEATGWRPRGPLRTGLADALAVGIDRPKIGIERVGIIGAGNIATMHLDALRRLSGVKVTGILDISATAAATVAARAGAPSFTDPDRFYREARPHIVHITTPPQTHCALALEAIEHGVQVLLEKPAALRLDEYDAMQGAAEAAGVTIGVDENFAFDPICRRACAALARGELGELVHIEVFFGYDVRRAADLSAARAARSWLRRLPGGLLEDALPHPLSVVRSGGERASRRSLAGRIDRPAAVRLR